MPAPQISTAVATGVRTAGGSTVRLIGDGLGRRQADLVGAWVGSANVSVAPIGGDGGGATWVSEQEVTVEVPPGSGSGQVRASPASRQACRRPPGGCQSLPEFFPFSFYVSFTF